MPPRRTILVTGATGKQGGATVSQLSALPGAGRELRILGLTRNAGSEAALALRRRHPHVELVQGDLDDVGALFDSLPATPDALFSVQAALGKGYTPQREMQQGRALHEAAVDVGVKHIVYASVDRHGSDSDVRATKVPHFDSKLEIEQHLQAECARHVSRSGTAVQTTWTILRPATFFDNLTPDLAGRVAAATVGRCSRPQQMVAVRDVGWFAARALTGFVDDEYSGTTTDRKGKVLVTGRYPWDESEEGESSSLSDSKPAPGAESEDAPGEQIAIPAPPLNPYAGRKISLAGDEIGLAAMRERFYEKMGYPLPEAYAWMGGGALWMSRERNAMQSWLGRVGFAADIAALRKEHPGMLRFPDWVEKESGFTRGAEVLGNWLS